MYRNSKRSGPWGTEHSILIKPIKTDLVLCSKKNKLLPCRLPELNMISLTLSEIYLAVILASKTIRAINLCKKVMSTTLGINPRNVNLLLDTVIKPILLSLPTKKHWILWQTSTLQPLGQHHPKNSS